MRNDRMQEGSTAVALAMVTPGYDQDPATGVADYASHQDQAQFEADKRAVYKHPLFPLLALLFERCEQATQSSDNSTSESFNMDIQAFVQHQERDRKPFLINDPEIDGLMIKAIQVLRIHLLELEKVQELCKDFCNRYITCLKGKMQSENLLRSDYGHHGHDGLAPSSGSNGSSPLQVLSSTGNDVESGANGLRVSDESSLSHHPRPSDPLAFESHQQQQHQQQLLRPSSGSRSSSSIDARHHRSPSDLDDHRSVSPAVHGGTPLSQIGAHPAPVNDMYLGQGSPSSMQSEDDEDAYSVAAGVGVGALSARKPKPKRGVLPKHATNIMRAWLFQHLVHPYPTEDEKRTIASETNLTLLQVNNWFINARRRILQPMLDGANTTDIGAIPVATTAPTPPPQIRNFSGKSRPKSKTNSKNLQQGDWQSEDSGSEYNGSSDGEGAYTGLDGIEQHSRDDYEDSEDGGIDIDETKPFVH
ncbi:homeobox protein Meis1-like isoform X2 [Phymastichus coffea]|uniref:homeobox protein Meis1-like isoform X2 n=1 Tax=Phymastichus coffea TaxID=108790 RepID=UPI00273AA8C9|nr:homeobox protein Meis1-like isoform X2 [Phymastichus coffea]